MTNSQIFKKAHRWTKLTIQAGDSYQATFALCLRALYAESRKPVITAEALEAIGGNRWQKGDFDRVYFSDLMTLYGLICQYYKSGKISRATLRGEDISNSKANAMAFDLRSGKFWYDVNTGEFAHKDLAPYFSDLVTAIQSKI